LPPVRAAAEALGIAMQPTPPPVELEL